MNNTIQKWIDAGILLRSNPESIVVCPVCDIGHLKVKDVIIASENKCDRYIICDKCGEYNIITFSI